MFEQSPQSIQVFAPDGRTLRVNRAWEELWGVTLDQIGDYNVLEDPQLVAKGVMPYIERGFAGEATAIPAVLYDPDETIPDITKHRDPRRLVRAFIYPIRDGQGRVSEVVLMHEDITEWKRAEESLRESEEQFRLLFENSQDAIVIADDAGNYLHVNESACELLGYPREQLLRMNVSDLQTTTSPDAATLYQVYTQKGSETGEFSFVCPDGERRVAQFTASRYAPGLHLSILRDITKRKVAEQALRESEDRYRDLVENSQELICTHDLEGRILSVNPWAVRVLGYEQSSLVGMNIRDGLAPEYRDELDEYIQKIKRDGFAKGVMQVRTAGGERRVWEYHNTLRTEGVEAPVVRGMAHDVTERKQALAREREARKEAEAANRLKDEFLATVSHELRTPLTSVVGWANMLRSGGLNAETTAHAVEVIERNAKAQAQIVEDILDMSRIITGKIRLNTQTTDPALTVTAAVETIRPAAHAKGIALVCAFDPQVGTVIVDPERLQQVAWNLLANAVKYTPQSGRVEVRLERHSGRVHLTVSDNGAGIDSTFLPYVFERFRQADSSTTREHGGLGLGLAIVRHLVELHGGTVSAASEGEGKGAAFTVSLPVNKHHQDGNVPLGSSTHVSFVPAEVESVDRYPTLGGLRLLVVEDEEDTLTMLAMVFGRCGAEVKAVGSTAEALSLMEEWQPHVLVSDLGLPGEDGYSLIRKVRERESREGMFIPAVALSGYARIEDKAQALAAGYQLHLAKPISPLELTNAVAGLTGRVGGTGPVLKDS